MVYTFLYENITWIITMVNYASIESHTLFTVSCVFYGLVLANFTHIHMDYLTETGSVMS